MEIWKEIKEAPDYHVSNLGRVKRVTAQKGTRAGKILALHIDSYGYPACHVVDPNGVPLRRKVHRLVCEAFHGPQPEGKYDVAHADGNRTNNNAGNLRWATRAENVADMLKHGTNVVKRGSSNRNSKLTEDDVRAIRSAPRRRGLLYELAAQYGISRNVVGNIRTATSPCWPHCR